MLIVTLMVFLAIYVSVGRMLTSNLAVFKTQILAELNSRLPFTVEAQQVEGEWYSFTPVIVLKSLRVSVEDSEEPPLELIAGRIGVDVMGSLRSGSLQLTRLMLDGLSMRGELTAEGRLRIRGFDGGGEIGDWFRDFLLNIELVGLRENQLELTLPGGETRLLDVSLRLEREGSYRRVEAELVSTRGTRINVLAEGVGDPFKPKLFSGDLYLDIQSTDLGAVKDVWANRPTGVWADGELDLELWFAWEQGEPSLEARAEAHGLRIADEQGSWQVPLDRLSLEARLLERKNRWTLFASDLEVEREGQVARLPRVQLDAWGEALRVRAMDVPLEPLGAMAAGMDAVPARLAEVLAVLQPRGRLDSLQLSLGSLDAPARDWALEANFQDLGVDSWKSGPALSSASGYVELDTDGGFVILDSQSLAIAFPTIYSEPLYYDDFYGTINLDWDERALTLSSGIIKALGVEGDVNVLFGLNIPLIKSEVGLEMDLLVGLRNAHPTHRVKYVPNNLNQTLYQWLDNSIGEGLVEEGAFLWRGALKKALAPMRTVQLAFNVSDTRVNYHTRWPAVTVQDGTILIDNTNVSVWSHRAKLYDTVVERLSVETWMNDARQIMLAVDGTMSGPAADGLRVLNESPVADLVGGAFGDWSLQGQLDVALQLQMNLTDRSVAPEVEVATRWQDVDLSINPGNLPVDDVNGGFTYSSAAGFSSEKLVGSIWGKPLRADVIQHAPTAGNDRGAVEVAIASSVDMANIRRWLSLESLAFAAGETAVDVQVLVPPGESARLRVDSSLAGVSLDLPSPWQKPAEEQRSLRLESPLAADGVRLEIQMDSELALDLDIVDGALRSGSLGVHGAPAPLAPGVLLVSGHAPLVEADQWTSFITRYFYSPEDGEAPASAVVDQASADRGLVIRVDRLQADQLVIWGQQFSDVTFSLQVDRGDWQLSAQTPWLRGEFLQPREKTGSRLTLDYLDLDGISDLDLSATSEEDEAAGEDEAALDLPDMEVSIARLDKGELSLGSLAFNLTTREEVLHAGNITGDLAGLRLLAAQPGSLSWRQGRDSQTSLRAHLEFQDIGDTLQRFGYERIVQTEKGAFDLDLSWPGAPQDFALQQGAGAVSVSIGQGSFLEAPSGASGALRVVSILNLAEIVRRLSLSHMFESGIPFDGVEGDIFLHSGVIEVARMNVSGPSSFAFSGVTDVADQTLDGELVATFPMANNLPWVAALTASLPVAAGVYVVSRVFQKQFNRLSSAVYKVGGSWDEPEVKFDHIFDDTSQDAAGTQARAVESATGGVPPADSPAALDPNAPPWPQDPNTTLQPMDPNLPRGPTIPLLPLEQTLPEDPNIPAVPPEPLLPRDPKDVAQSPLP